MKRCACGAEIIIDGKTCVRCLIALTRVAMALYGAKVDELVKLVRAGNSGDRL